jgi:hypothetical protein
MSNLLHDSDEFFGKKLSVYGDSKVVIINGCERFPWKDGCIVSDGYGAFLDHKNKSSVPVKFLRNEPATAKELSAATANKIIGRMLNQS